MRSLYFAVVAASLALVLSVSAAWAVPAFPGAVGGGASAVGGRGGVVIPVTTLADAGPGSLRACVEARGPRVCVFRVAGTIELRRPLWIGNPYLTVAGQTAPGGIELSGKAFPQSVLMVAAHDVVIRYLRVRHGFHEAGNDVGSNIILFSGAERVVIDHVSSQWNQDEGIGAWRDGQAPLRNVTISNSLIGEGLEPHSTGAITGAADRFLADGMTDIDFTRNLVMNNSHRNPLLKHKSGRLINNIFFNSSYYYTQIGGGANIDIVRNIYRKGPMSGPAREVQVFPSGTGTASNGSPSIYVGGNQRFTPGDQWAMVAMVPGENQTERGALSENHRRRSVMDKGSHPIPALRAEFLERSLLPVVGASRRLDCEGRWVPARDATDQRMVDQYRTGKGITARPRHERDVGGFPAQAIGQACDDTDGDGMPDAYERARGLDPKNDADGARQAGRTGWTNFEVYLAGR